MAGEIDVTAWLDDTATHLDTSNDAAAQILPRLAEAGLFGIGVPVTYGGSGGDIDDAVGAISVVSERSLAAGFVFWGHRTFIEYLLQSPNAALRDKLLAVLEPVLGPGARIELEPGIAEDSIARREAAEREAAQREAEQVIRNDPAVGALMAQFRTARIVPGSIKPLNESRKLTP